MAQLGDPHWLPPVMERPADDDPPIGWSARPDKHAFSSSPRPETRTCVKCGRFADHEIHQVEPPAEPAPRWDRR